MTRDDDMHAPLAEKGESVLDPRLREERQSAVRLLLMHPFVTDAHGDSDTFVLVRRHAAWLKTWFMDQLGYRLRVDAEFARLFKHPAPDALPRPLRSRSGSEFDPRRYTLLCLVLAALERMEVQTILSALAQEVKLLAASEESIAPLDLQRYVERQGFVDAIRVLVDLGVLRLTDGDDAAFVDGSGDALYDISSRHLSQLLATTLPPSLASGPEELVVESYPPTDEGKTRRARHRLMRRLIEEPVVYLEDLGEDEQAYLTSQRHYLLQQVALATGREVEVRREGLALIDDGGHLSDIRFPTSGTVAHAALLLAGHLARESSWRETVVEVARSDLHLVVQRLVTQHRRYWSKIYHEDDGPERLLEVALRKLADLNLIALRPEGVLPRPAIARYRLVAKPH